MIMRSRVISVSRSRSRVTDCRNSRYSALTVRASSSAAKASAFSRRGRKRKTGRRQPDSRRLRDRAGLRERSDRVFAEMTRCAKRLKRNKRQAIAAGQVLLAALATVWVNRAAFAQSTALTVPQSIRFEHAVIIERLTKETARAGATGVVAQKRAGIVIV